MVREADVPRLSSAIRLVYARASDAAETIRPFLSSQGGSVVVDARTNQLIVTDTRARIWEIEGILHRLDRKDPEVLIEAKIVQISLKDEFRMGIDWAAVVRRVHGLHLSSVWGGIGAGGKGSAMIGTLSDDDYRLVLEALGSADDTRVISSPRIAVVDGQEARILIGSTKPYVTTTTTTNLSGPVSVSEDVKFIDVGIKLVVTPAVHDDGEITMKIRPEVSSAAASLKTAQNNLIPIVETSQVETTVRVRDGTTLMIGGLIRDGRTSLESKVPVLGDIPLLGAAFRSRSSGKDRAETVIFLTPRIISGER